MILDHLITGYLDGDLTPEQDSELRSMMSADPAAREAFDAAVLIHIALRCEDPTEVPESARRAVLDSIEAMAHPLERSELVMSPVRSAGSRMVRAAALTAVLLFAALHTIDDSAWQLRAHQAATAITNSVSDPQSVSERQSRYRYTANVQASQVACLDTLPVEHISVADTVQPETQAPYQSHPPLQWFLGANVAVGEVPQGNATTEQQRPEVQTTSISISTSYAAGIGSSVTAAEQVRQLTASIGYGLSDADMFGLEVGATAYTIQRLSTVTQPVGGSRTVVNRGPVMGAPTGGKLSSPDSPTQTFRPDSAIVVSEERQVWGSAFYERKLLVIDNLALRTRLGAGVSEDGLIGYGRVTGEWKVNGILSIVAGAEVRGMPFRTGSVGGASGATSYGSVVTALTGMYLRF
jgi:hypothetical protein